MNYLAHQLAAGANPELRAGGFLGDFIKGPLDGAQAVNLPQPIKHGIQLHRRLDSFTDFHPTLKSSRARLGKDVQRIAPIAMDVCIDHFLCRHWPTFHDQPLNDYCRDTYTLLRRYQAILPAPALRFLNRAEEDKLFQSYRDWRGVERTLTYLSSRMRKPELLLHCISRLPQHYNALENDFHEYFPALLDQAQTLRQQLAER